MITRLLSNVYLLEWSLCVICISQRFTTFTNPFTYLCDSMNSFAAFTGMRAE